MTHFRPLIDCPTLYARLDAPDWRVVDCRFRLDDLHAGRQAWKTSHIPGAVYADIERDLSGRVGRSTGRHPLPAREQLVVLFNALGISNESRVVAYDDMGGAFAARLWWLLRWMGHEHVAVLDGGWTAWVDSGFPVSDRPPRPPDAAFIEHDPLLATVSASDILHGLDSDRYVLVDARAAERYTGEVEPIDPIAGHIPGAVNLPFAGNLDDAGSFLSPYQLRQRFGFPQSDHNNSADVVHYCGSGVTACHNVLAMEVAGMPGSKLYPGSWSEWITDRNRPVAQPGKRDKD